MNEMTEPCRTETVYRFEIRTPTTNAVGFHPSPAIIGRMRCRVIRFFPRMMIAYAVLDPFCQNQAPRAS